VRYWKWASGTLVLLGFLARREFMAQYTLDNVKLGVGLRYLAIHTWSGELTMFMASNWDSVNLTQPTRKFFPNQMPPSCVYNREIWIEEKNLNQIPNLCV
jgi:hypothetical protein